MKKTFSHLICGAAIMLLFAFAGEIKAQNALTLRAIDSGEKVQIRANGKSKIVNLDRDYPSDFTPGGNPPNRYTTLLSVKKGDSFYLVAKFTSGPAVTGPNAPCSGDTPVTLLLVQTDKNLTVEKVQTEIYQSCAFNGSGRELKGRLMVTKTKVSLAFDEGSKKYALTFDAGEAEKGLQLTKR
jgi:hypothetical protein